VNCAHCGKKNSEDRLFCGFCGMPLGTPEKAPAGDEIERLLFGRPKDEQRRAERAPEPAADVPEEKPAERPVRPAPSRPAPGAPPRRLTKAPEEPAGPLAKPILSEPVELRAKRPPVLMRSAAPGKPRNPNTIVPPRTADFDDMFMEDGDSAYDFDSDDMDDRYPDVPRQGFMARHARGLVSLTLLTLTLLIVGYWLIFGAGQRVLGQLYLSDNPETYIALGDEAEQSGAHEVAGAYYLKALELKPRDRNYAIKAANAYIVAGNSGKTTAAIEKLIAIEPDDVSAYLTLQSLYPDPAARPVKVQQLLEQGYQRTGDARLRES